METPGQPQPKRVDDKDTPPGMKTQTSQSASVTFNLSVMREALQALEEKASAARDDYSELEPRRKLSQAVQEAASDLDNQDADHLRAFTRLVALLLSVQTEVALAKQQPGNKRVFVPVALLMSALFTTCGLPVKLAKEFVNVPHWQLEGNTLQRHATKNFSALTNQDYREALRNLNTVEELSAAWQVDSEYFGVTSVDPSSKIMDCTAESFSTTVSLAGKKIARFIEGSAALLFMAQLGSGGTKRYRPLKQAYTAYPDHRVLCRRASPPRCRGRSWRCRGRSWRGWCGRCSWRCRTSPGPPIPWRPRVACQRGLLTVCRTPGQGGGQQRRK